MFFVFFCFLHLPRYWYLLRSFLIHMFDAGFLTPLLWRRLIKAIKVVKVLSFMALGQNPVILPAFGKHHRVFYLKVFSCLATTLIGWGWSSKPDSAEPGFYAAGWHLCLELSQSDWRCLQSSAQKMGIRVGETIRLALGRGEALIRDFGGAILKQRWPGVKF